MKAHHMVVHVKGRPAIEVDGLEWEADRAGVLLAVEVYDEQGEFLGTEVFPKEPMRPGTSVRMPSEVFYIDDDAPPCG